MVRWKDEFSHYIRNRLKVYGFEFRTTQALKTLPPILTPKNNRTHLMKKTIKLLSIVFISIVLSVFYGITHDFITSKISPEFYTKFTFFNFAILDDYERTFNGNWTFALIWGWDFSQLGGLVF